MTRTPTQSHPHAPAFPTAQASTQPWYFERAGRREGPVSSAQLRALAAQGELAADTLVWREGLAGWVPAMNVNGLLPEGASFAPPTRPSLAAEQGDATGGIIPYKNPQALFAYYLGIFSVIPLFPIGITACVLGVRGLNARKRNPAIKGAAHAWIGILVGGFFSVIWTFVTVMIIYGATR